MADVGDGSHRDGERVEELDWKAAQRRQAEIMAEEEAAAQKRRSGRGSFTFTDGHPKDRGGNAGRNKVTPNPLPLTFKVARLGRCRLLPPQAVYWAQGRGSVGGRSDLTRSRIEEEQANP